MTHLFSVLLEQSLTACWVIPAVLLLRFCLKKAPKRVTNLLWLVVAFRLICPVSFESNLSLVTQAQNLSHAAAELRDEVEAYRPVDTQPTVTLPEDIVFDTPVTPTEPAWPENPVLPVLPESPETPEIVIPPMETPREQPFISRQLMLQAGCGIWLAGVGFMALFGMLSTRQWRKRVQTAVRCEDGLWRSESVESPFILGVLRPKIYLPFVLPFGAESHVIAHEQAHLKRRDPLWKCFAFALLAIYWFHPLVWVSYFLFCRDIELACDQQVTRNLDAEGKKAYSRALLACTVSRDPLLCPLSFGEVDVKARVKAVLRKKPGKLLTLTALALCTVLIICCAANPKEEHPWDEAYRQTLEDLLKQYGANEDYGLQSVTTLDLWEDGVPELVVLRKQNETVHSDAVSTMMIYEYVGGEAVLRYDTSFGKTSPDSEVQWNRAEDGVRFMVFTPLTDKADYPNVQKVQVRTVSNPIPDDWSVSSRLYNQMEDGRWVDLGTSSGIVAGIPRILADEEATVLFADTESLMERDWQRFLKKNAGAACYQRAYLKELETIDSTKGPICHTLLLDMDQDGTPELITGSRDEESGPMVYLLSYRPETPYNGVEYHYAQLNYRYGNDENLIFSVTEYRGKPVLLYYRGGSGGGWNDWIMAVTMENGACQLSSLKADGGPDAAGIRSNLKYHRKSGPLFGTTEEMDISSDEFESLRAELLQNARDFDPSVYKRADFYSEQYVWQALSRCEMETFAFSQTEVTADEYAPVLQALIAEYGAFRKDEKTDLILGLKYAGLHDLGGDETPELVTLVNTRDADMGLHFTLRVYCSENGRAKLIHQTELGGRYGQTDVSHTFNVGHELITYHTTDEWIEEIAHVYDVDTGTTVFRAITDGQNGGPTRDELEQFWIDGEVVSAGQYVVLDFLKEDTMEIDVCWDVAPASRADLEAFLGKMGVDIDAVPAGYGETAAAAHYSRLSDLMALHGTTSNGIVGAMLVDLEQDDVPELLVQHGMGLELYRYEKNHSRLIWNGPIGVRFGQTDASYEYIITTHIDTFCIIIHDSKDAWMEEVWRVITLENGVIHEKKLRAWAEADTSFLPERDNLIHFSIDGVEVPKKKYDYCLGDLLDGSMAVSAVDPYARPNSDEYMADLLNQLATGNLPEIGDSEHRAIAWWLMANNDGDPLDEETAMKFGAAKREFPAEPPVHCEEGSVFMWNEPYDFCRYVQNGGEEWLILAYREERTEIARGTAYHVDKNGYLTAVEKDLVLDTFRATLVGDFDGQTLVHRRYHTDCYSGMEGCEDCFRTDLILWNADRTEYVKLIENAPLANHFEVIAREGNIVTVAYQTGPAHSEYNKTVTVQVDLNKKTCTQAEESDFSVAYGELTYRGKTYDLPQQSALSSGDHTVEQVGKHLLIATHINPDHNAYDVFNTETLTFENSFWGLVLDWQGDDLTTLIYCQWQTLFTYDQLALGEFAQSVDPNVLRVENGWFSDDGSAFTISYSDDTGLVQQEVFPIPDREILVAVNTLDGRTIWRTGLLFCPTYNGLTNTEALALATELVDRYGPVSQWPFESCRVDHTPNGSTKLTLLQPHNESKLCLDYTFYLEPNGTLWRAEDCIADGYSGTLVYENDDCAIIASRRAEGCLRGGDPCGYCYVTDLTLWNTDRTKGTLLLEGAELGINFTVLDGPDENGVLSISYHTGLSHSDSTTMVFGDINLFDGTYTEIAREWLD